MYLKIHFDWNFFIYGFKKKVTLMNKIDNIIVKNIISLDFQFISPMQKCFGLFRHLGRKDKYNIGNFPVTFWTLCFIEL